LGVAVLGTVFVLTLGHGAAAAFTTGTLPHADPALATATRRVAAIATGLLALGLVVALRLRESDGEVGPAGVGRWRRLGGLGPRPRCGGSGGDRDQAGRGTPGDRGESSS
jgi:hypothetical protein